MIALADYQVAAFKWLTARDFGILADEPGVGKTHPAIEAAKTVQGRKMLVVPAYLISNWVVELERCNVLDVGALIGTGSKRDQIYSQDHEWTIMSYELFGREHKNPSLNKRQWGLIIFDEAHRLRGRDSERTLSAHALRKYVRKMWFLTGTPLVANGGDIFPLLKLCDPKCFTSYWRFVEDNCRVELTPWEKKVGKPRDPELFNRLLSPYMLRRRLSDVLPEIPEVVEQQILVELTPKLRSEYKQIKTEYKIANPDGEQTRIGAGGLVSALRNFVNQSKFDALKGLLQDLPEDEQVVVFCWHRKSVDSILAEGWKSIIGFTGNQTATERQKTIAQFCAGEFRVLVATLATMQEGVNLQNARHVIFFEEDWLATTNEQAVARLRRRGQTQTVLKYVINVRKTIDESVHKVQLKRGKMTLEAVFDDIWKEDV